MRKQPKDKEQEELSRNIIEPTDTWINKTRTKKGFIIFCKDDFHEGDILLGGMQALQEFINGERTGINLGKMVDPDEEE